jgi:uncharacterized membrane protein
MRTLAVLLALPLLFACSGETSTPAAPVEAPEPVVLGGVDLNQPVRALGTEPFWGVEITTDTLTYSGLDRPEQTAPNPGPQVQGTTAVYAAETGDGATMTVTLIATECSDGMSDRVYPLTASVEIGSETLNGCAQSAAALAAEPRP